MPTQNQINYYRKQLYLAARNQTAQQCRNDDEEVKALRDAFIAERFAGRGYKELDFDELKQAIDELSGLASPKKNSPISYNQLKMIKFYTVALGLVYCPLAGLRFEDSLGKAIDESVARKAFRSDFNNKHKLPSKLLRHLYAHWINPTCNKMLKEGGHKKYIKNESFLYYEQLSSEQAQYLLQRLVAMYQQVSRADVSEHIYNYNCN